MLAKVRPVLEHHGTKQFHKRTYSNMEAEIKKEFDSILTTLKSSFSLGSSYDQTQRIIAKLSLYQEPTLKQLLTCRDQHGRALLHHAVGFSNAPLTKWLLDISKDRGYLEHLLEMPD